MYGRVMGRGGRREWSRKGQGIGGEGQVGGAQRINFERVKPFTGKLKPSPGVEMTVVATEDEEKIWLDWQEVKCRRCTFCWVRLSLNDDRHTIV